MPALTMGILQIQHEVLLNTHVSINIYFQSLVSVPEALCVKGSQDPSDSHSLRMDFFVLYIRGNYFKMHIVAQGNTLSKLG